MTDLSTTSRKVEIGVPASEVRAEYAKACESISRSVSLPGFRPGRIPSSAIRMRFSKELRSEVLSHLVSHALSHAVKDHNLDVVGEPRIDDQSLDLRDGRPFHFSAEVDIIPSFELKPYFGISLTRRITTVTDKEIDEAIDDERNQHIEFVPIEDRPSATGDIVTIDITGKYVIPDDGPAPSPAESEELKSEDLRVELGAEGVQAEFNENLSGVRPGDIREFRVAYPAEFTSTGLADKTLDFTATVKGVHRKEIPEFNDEFAATLGFDDAAAMRTSVRENLEKAARQRADDRLHEDLISFIIDQHQFEYPQNYLRNRQQESVIAWYRQLISSGRYTQMNLGISEMQVHTKRINRFVERKERASAILMRIASAESIELAENELMNDVTRRAQAARVSVEEMADHLTKNGAISTIANELLGNKVLELLTANAEISVEQISAEEEENIVRAERERMEAEIDAEIAAEHSEAPVAITGEAGDETAVEPAGDQPKTIESGETPSASE